jgi:ferric iron reductase protein FhuF
MIRGSTPLVTELHASGCGEELVAGFPRTELAATLEELAVEQDMRSVIIGRWRSALALTEDPDGEVAAVMAALSDIVTAVVRPVVTALLASNAAVLVEPHRIAIGWDAGAEVVGVGWLEQAVLSRLPRSSSRRATRDALVATLAPVVEVFCREGGIPTSVGWSVVADAVQAVGIEVGEFLGDTPAAAAEVVLLLDGRAPITDRARVTAMACDGEVQVRFDRVTCCQRCRQGPPCRGCPVGTASSVGPTEGPGPSRSLGDQESRAVRER